MYAQKPKKGKDVNQSQWIVSMGEVRLILDTLVMIIFRVLLKVIPAMEKILWTSSSANHYINTAHLGPAGSVMTHL